MFVLGRLIFYNVLITFETVYWIKSRKGIGMGLMAFKLDMSKAYDRVEWSFLEAVRLKLGFDRRWVGWIMACVNSVSFSVLINGAQS